MDGINNIRNTIVSCGRQAVQFGKVNPVLAVAVVGIVVVGAFLESRNGSKMAEEQQQQEEVSCDTSLDPFKNDTTATGTIPPNIVYCPITLQIMVDPVVASDGNTYERTAIERVFQEGNPPRSPLTREPFENLHLTPNNVIRSLAREYRSI
mmetsp:Transcript_22368/g.51583  ORF Transcript_22368/g.51583 Transcript_22368/m.51583 type:complete len:151 (-) Transcript_22368:229-681(-)